eukprot:127937-Hanusia_phi.AAC.3
MFSNLSSVKTKLSSRKNRDVEILSGSSKLFYKLPGFVWECRGGAVGRSEGWVNEGWGRPGGFLERGAEVWLWGGYSYH